MDPLLKAGFIKNYIREKIVSQLHTGPRQWEGPGGASPASAFPPGPPCAADASPHHVPKPRFYWSAVRLIFIVSPKQLPGGSTARWWLPAADPAFGGDVLASGPHWGLGAGRAFVLLPSSWQHGGRSRPFLQVLWLNHEGRRGSPPRYLFQIDRPREETEEEERNHSEGQNRDLSASPTRHQYKPTLSLFWKSNFENRIFCIRLYSYLVCIFVESRPETRGVPFLLDVSAEAGRVHVPAQPPGLRAAACPVGCWAGQARPVAPHEATCAPSVGRQVSWTFPNAGPAGSFLEPLTHAEVCESIGLHL